MEILIIILIVIVGMIGTWIMGINTGWTKGFNDGIAFRNKQLKERNENKIPFPKFMKKETIRSKWWDTMCAILDGQFPKHECKERGRAIVMLTYFEMMLNGTKFNEDGKPISKSDEMLNKKVEEATDKVI